MISASTFSNRAGLLALASFLVAACGSAGGKVVSTPPVADAEPVQLCDAAPAQYHIGQNVTEAMGAAILRETGARTLRWGPPRSAWTMDYRQDRVNVRYDDEMKIIDVTCG
ncbi:MAG: hypothetical protein ABS49_01715 [Erythrobacter sp. SCN 62-14]|nr:MAG: hypothetical protein ABS49_01715 [Erythrobacter sp. SCN 62-14]